MPVASILTQRLFVGLVFALAGMLAFATLKAPGRTASRQGILLVSVILAFYLIVPALLAATGRLDRYDPLPAPALLLVLAVTIATVAWALSPVGARVALSIPLGVLVGFQVFRIPVEVLLHRLAGEGVIPFEMTYTGRNFDIVTGVTGGLLGIALLRGRAVPRSVLLAWNVLGLLLLANIVGVAALSTPTPFRVFTDGPPNLLPSTVPFVWLPTFLVQLALAGHLLLFRRLASGRFSEGIPS